MENPKQPRASPMLVELRTSFHMCVFITDVYNAAIWPFTRSNMGIRGMGTAGFWAMLFIPIYAGFANAPDMITYYWQAWMAMAIYRRITADNRQNTQYHGIPWMFGWCTSSELTARMLEAAAMPVLGALVSGFSEDIGQFITLGVFPFGFRYIIDAATIARRREAAHNARIEMQAAQEFFHRERGR